MHYLARSHRLRSTIPRERGPWYPTTKQMVRGPYPPPALQPVPYLLQFEHGSHFVTAIAERALGLLAGRVAHGNVTR